MGYPIQTWARIDRTIRPYTKCRGGLWRDEVIRIKRGLGTPSPYTEMTWWFV